MISRSVKHIAVIFWTPSILLELTETFVGDPPAGPPDS